MRILALLSLMAGPAMPAIAQDQPGAAPATEIDATKLGVDLDRIQRGLRIAESREKSDVEGLRLNFSVQVFGQAPKLDILQDIDLINGAVPGTAPTHRQFIEQVTPPIYRTPGGDFLGLAIMAVQKLVERRKRARCDDEIEAYRELLMQGVNVPAPRCTQEQ